MELKQYIQECLRTCTLEGTETEKVCVLCLGLAGETGEVVDYLKKVGFHGHEFNKEKLTGELGDLLWYFTMLANYFNINIEEIMQQNIEKLKKRYPNGFNEQDSINRNI